MKMRYTKTKLYGETVRAIEWKGNVYALAKFTGNTVGWIRLAFYDEHKKRYGLLIEEETGERHWMPVGLWAWGNVRECMNEFPGAKLWFLTAYDEKRMIVDVLDFGWFPGTEEKTDSVQNSSEQGTCTASSVPPTGSAAVLGDTPNTPEREANE